MQNPKLPPLKSKRYNIQYLFDQALHHPDANKRKYYQQKYQLELNRRQQEVIKRKFVI